MRIRTNTVRALALPMAAGLVSAPLLFAAPATASDHTSKLASVTVLHGVPGLTVDVYANNEELIPNFEPGTLSETLSIPAGSYDLEVFADGEGPDGTPAISADDVEVPAGANASIAAHLNASGEPTLSVFVNDTSAVDAGQGRLTVRHTAQAPAVDVRAGGEVVFSNLENGKGESAELPAGTVSADVVVAGTDTVAIGPADVEVAEGASTIVYAWGAPGNYQLATQTISDLGSAPHSVDAGEAGLAGEGMPAWALGLMAFAGLGIAAAGTSLARGRA